MTTTTIGIRTFTGVMVNPPFDLQNLSMFTYDGANVHLDFMSFHNKYILRREISSKLSSQYDDFFHRYEFITKRMYQLILDKTLHDDTITGEDRAILNEIQPHFRTAFASRLYNYSTNIPDFGHFATIIDSSYLLFNMDPQGFDIFKPILSDLFLNHLPEEAKQKKVFEYIREYLPDEHNFKYTDARLQFVIRALSLEGESYGRYRYNTTRLPFKEPAYYMCFPRTKSFRKEGLSSKTGGSLLSKTVQHAGGRGRSISDPTGKKQSTPLSHLSEQMDDLSLQEGKGGLKKKSFADLFTSPESHLTGGSSDTLRRTSSVRVETVSTATGGGGGGLKKLSWASIVKEPPP